MSALEQTPLVTDQAEGVIVRPMLTISDAIDLFMGDLARRGRTDRTRTSYLRILDKFNERFPRHWDAAKVTPEDCERFLDQFANLTKGSQAQAHAPLNNLFRFLYRTRRIRSNPMEFVPTVTRTRPDDLDVITINPLDVPTLLREARPWSELTAIGILAYLGPRRHAVALLRLDDYDRRTGQLRFREKGSKTIWKPVPAQLAGILDAAIAAGAVSPDQPYLVPPQGPLSRKGDRNDRVIWRLVKNVAGRAGIEAHVHALRGAFACFYLLQNPGDLRGLQKLLGHASPATTEVYLRRFDSRIAMEPVRTLAWLDNASMTGITEIAGNRYESSPLVGAGGFEPPYGDSPHEQRAGLERSPATDLHDRAATVADTADEPRLAQPGPGGAG